jgi:hypothetical protein
MPPPPSQRAQVEPPEQVTTEAVKGFAVGALRVGNYSAVLLFGIALLEMLD